MKIQLPKMLLLAILEIKEDESWIPEIGNVKNDEGKVEPFDDEKMENVIQNILNGIPVIDLSSYKERDVIEFELNISEDDLKFLKENSEWQNLDDADEVKQDAYEWFVCELYGQKFDENFWLENSSYLN